MVRVRLAMAVGLEKGREASLFGRTAIPKRSVENDSGPAFFGIVCGVSGWGIRQCVGVGGRTVSMMVFGRAVQ